MKKSHHPHHAYHPKSDVLYKCYHKPHLSSAGMCPRCQEVADWLAGLPLKKGKWSIVKNQIPRYEKIIA